MGYPVSNLEAEPTIISNKCNPRTKYHSQKVVHQLSHNTYQGPRSNLQVVVSTSSQQWSNVFSLQVTGDPQIGTHDLRQTVHMYITHTTNDRPMRQLFGAQHHNPQAKARKKKKTTSHNETWCRTRPSPTAKTTHQATKEELTGA